MDDQSESPAPAATGNGAGRHSRRSDPENNEDAVAAQVFRRDLICTTTQWRLHINERFTGVTVRPDSQYPNMWRIHANGRVSDMVNLARAKDAALTWARRDGLARRDRVRWGGVQNACSSPADAKNRGGLAWGRTSTKDHARKSRLVICGCFTGR